MDEEQPGHGRVAPGLVLAALWLLAAVSYAFLGHRNAIPSISPDEFSYGHLARSVADGEGLAWRGLSEPIRAALYIYAITPAWLIGSTTSAFALAKVLGAAMSCAVVVPVWLLARRSVGPWTALLPAALAVAGTWMLVSASILTENLAYPLGVGALAAMVVAIQRPGTRWLWIAIGLTALAMFSRAQLAVLLAVLPLAALADAARAGRPGLRAGLERQRLTLLIGAGLLLIGTVVVLVAPTSVLGTYSGLQDYTPGLGAALSSAGRHAIGLVAMAGLVPAVLVLGLTIQRSAWADEHVGPLLAVFWAATAVVIAQVAWYMAGGGRTWHIDRYMMYLVPLAATVLVAGAVRTPPSWRPLLAITGVLSALLLLSPPLRNVTEEEGTFGVLRPVHAVFGTSAAVSLALATLLVGLIAVVLSRRRASGGLALAGALTLLTLGVFVIQDVASWSWRIQVLHDVRAAQPADLRWLDHAPGGPVARVVVEQNTLASQITDFFNRDIDQVYVPDPALGVVSGPIVRGRTCPWNVGGDGTLTVGLGCGAPPTRMLLDDPVAKLTFAGQRVVTNGPSGRIVELPAGAPRLLSLIFDQCSPRLRTVDLGSDGIPHRVGPVSVCAPVIRGNLWVDRPGRLELRFSGGQSAQQVAAGGQVTAIPPGKDTTVTVSVPARPTAFDFKLDWQGGAPQFPELQAVELIQGSTRQDLLGRAGG